MKSATMYFGAGIILVYLYAFLIPGRVDLYALSPSAVRAGEYWRFLTYPFVHLNLAHLGQNIFGVVVLSFIAHELNATFSEFGTTYFAAGFLAVIPLWLVLAFTALGASTAIFAGFGFLALECRKFELNPTYILAFLIFLIFLNTLTTALLSADRSHLNVIMIQDISHFCGLVFGMAFFFATKRVSEALAQKRRIILRRL